MISQACVIHSVHIGGLPSHNAMGQADPPPARRQTPQKTDGQQAGGTHPTEMHTCLLFK